MMRQVEDVVRDDPFDIEEVQGEAGVAVGSCLAEDGDEAGAEDEKEKKDGSHKDEGEDELVRRDLVETEPGGLCVLGGRGGPGLGGLGSGHCIDNGGGK